MTPEEADKAYDEAEAIPMTEAEIDRLVKIATGSEHCKLTRYDYVIIEGSDDVEFVRDYQGEWVRFDDVCEQSKVIRQLESENAKRSSMLRAAMHLFLGSDAIYDPRGDTGPTHWLQTRDRWIAEARKMVGDE